MVRRMKTLQDKGTETSERKYGAAPSPGIWSTDDYIRRWAQSRGMRGECIVPLQSLHDEWKARINFDQDGQPVERIATRANPRN